MRNLFLAEVLFENASIQDFPEAAQNLKGLEVNALEVIQPSEMMCTTMSVTVENPQQASAVLKCSRNSPDVSLVQATLRPDGVRFQSEGGRKSAAARC